METTEKTIDVLNDLIEINNDRIAGFEKATKELEDSDIGLKAIFEKMAADSRSYVRQLTDEVKLYGGDSETGNSVSGTIHRAWLDVKATFSGHDRKSILEECERGEDAIKKAYQSAMEPENELSSELVSILSQQKAGIEAGHDQIKALRDTY